MEKTARAFRWREGMGAPPVALAALFMRSDTETGLHGTAVGAAKVYYAQLRRYVQLGYVEASPLGLELLDRHGMRA
jgi:hypothetical protein